MLRRLKVLSERLGDGTGSCSSAAAATVAHTFRGSQQFPQLGESFPRRVHSSAGRIRRASPTAHNSQPAVPATSTHPGGWCCSLAQAHSSAATAA